MNMNVCFGKIFVLALLLSAVLAALEVFVPISLHGIRLAGAGVAVVIGACPRQCDLQLGGWDAASGGLLLARVRTAGIDSLPPNVPAVFLTTAGLGHDVAAQRGSAATDTACYDAEWAVLAFNFFAAGSVPVTRRAFTVVAAASPPSLASLPDERSSSSSRSASSPSSPCSSSSSDDISTKCNEMPTQPAKKKWWTLPWWHQDEPWSGRTV